MNSTRQNTLDYGTPLMCTCMVWDGGSVLTVNQGNSNEDPGCVNLWL